MGQLRNLVCIRCQYSEALEFEVGESLTNYSGLEIIKGMDLFQKSREPLIPLIKEYGLNYIGA